MIVFKGEEKPAKEWECVLIYDEATQTYTLEKLDSLVNLNFDCKAPPRTRTAASRAFPFPAEPSCVHAYTMLTWCPVSLHVIAPTASSSSVQTPQRSPVRTAADELEAQLADASSTLDIDGDADADGEPDPSFSLAQEEEEEEEGQISVGGPPVHHTPTPRPSHKKAAPLPPPPIQQAKSRPAPPKKSVPPPALPPQSAKANRVSAAAASAPSSKPKPRPVLPPPTAPTPNTTPPSTKRSSAEHPDVEDFEIRGPIAPVSASTTKRTSKAGAPPAPGQASSFSLALPTASAGPDPLAHQGLYAGTGTSAAPATAGATESDDEWDEILAQPPLQPPQHATSEQAWTLTIEDDADADADDGLDFLERELLGEDEPVGDADADADGDADADEDLEQDLEEEMMRMVGEPAMGHASRGGGGAGGAGGPMSMNQFVGGDAAMDDDDDDFSSSEESDED